MLIDGILPLEHGLVLGDISRRTSRRTICSQQFLDHSWFGYSLLVLLSAQTHRTAHRNFPYHNLPTGIRRILPIVSRTACTKWVSTFAGRLATARRSGKQDTTNSLRKWSWLNTRLSGQPPAIWIQSRGRGLRISMP